MKTIILTLACCLSFALYGKVSAQQTEFKSIKSTLVDPSRATNPYIKSMPPTSDEWEEKTRGACSMYFSNYTGYYVNVFLEGYYRGQISPWGGAYITGVNGLNRLYFQSSGGTREWADTVYCPQNIHLRD